MNPKDVIKNMKESIGTKDPEVFFSHMTDMFVLLFDRLDSVQTELRRVQLNSTMAIQWDPRLALNMIDDEIHHMRTTGKDPLQGGNIYEDEIRILQTVYMNAPSLNNYSSFCKFWQDTLGYHPFLEARK